MNFDFSKVLGNTAVKEEPKVVAPISKNEAINLVQKQKVTVLEDAPKVTPINNNVKIVTEPTNVIDYSNIDEKKEVARLSGLMDDIKNELNNKFIERETEIDMLALAFVSGTNAFLHGVPGTGKSDLVESFSQRFINTNYFRLLMSKTTEPSEIFGPVSINALKQDTHKVNTDNKLPKAHISFLDEVFKANSAILNGLLTIMNEKVFFNDTVEDVPLISLVGASNEFPEEDSLEALYDRFLIRLNVEPIKDVNNRVGLFKAFINSRNKNSALNKNVGNATNDKVTTMTHEDLQIFMELCKRVTFDEKLIEEYNMLFVKLEKEGIIVSDRRKNEAIKVIQASAVLNGSLQADLSDLAPLSYCFWSDIDELPIIKAIISKMANPDQHLIETYSDSLSTLKNDLKDFMDEHKDDNNFGTVKAIKLTEIKSSVSFAIDKIDEHIDSTSNKRSKERLEKLKGEFDSFLSEILNLLIG